MELLGICGSPRQKNSYYMVKTVLEATGEEYDILFLKDYKYNHCQACVSCEKEPYQCCQEDDMQKIYSMIDSADSIVLGSPTYFDNVTGLMKDFIDRCLPYYMSRKLEGKKAALAVVGSEDEESISGCLNALKQFCKHQGLDVVGSVMATRSNPKANKNELIELGKKITNK